MPDEPQPSRCQRIPACQTSRPLSFVGLASAAGALVCLFSLMGFAGRWGWLFEITSHFRAQYVAILAGLAVLFFWKRHRLYSRIFLGFAALNFWLIAPFLFGAPVRAATGGNRQLRLLSWNVNSENRDFASLTRLLAREQPDVVLLLEVDSAWQEFLKREMTDFPHRMVEARDDNFGIALFSQTSLAQSETLRLGEAGLPSLAATIPLGTAAVRLLGTHPLPPAGSGRTRLRDDQLREIARWARGQNMPAVVVGDLNVTPWSPLFADLLAESRLSNSAEGRGLHGTWPAFFRPMLIPIDHFLHSNEVAVTRRKILDAAGSDHLPQLVEFTIR